MKYFITALTSMFALSAQAQVDETTEFDMGGTCETAIELSLEDESFLNPSALSEMSLEYKHSALESFHRDLNLTWYQFTATEDEMIGFDITPIERGDNLDFLLFKAETKKTCPQIYSAQIQAIRRNLVQGHCGEKVSTGLAIGNSGDAYSTPIEAKKGDRFYLVVNNVYNNAGHYIKLKQFKKRTINGKIKTDNLKNASTQLLWFDHVYDQVIARAQSDTLGNYQIETVVDETDLQLSDYELVVVTNGYAVKSISIEDKQLEQPLNINLKSIIKGEICDDEENHLYFIPNSPDKIGETSKARLELLVKEMRFNDHMKIQLEGHSNGVFPSTEVDDKLSYARAQSVKDYLLSKGIENHRIFVKSFGSEKQLYPKARNEEEESRNRRVEVRYLDF